MGGKWAQLIRAVLKKLGNTIILGWNSMHCNYKLNIRI